MSNLCERIDAKGRRQIASVSSQPLDKLRVDFHPEGGPHGQEPGKDRVALDQGFKMGFPQCPNKTIVLRARRSSKSQSWPPTDRTLRRKVGE